MVFRGIVSRFRGTPGLESITVGWDCPCGPQILYGIELEHSGE